VFARGETVFAVAFDAKKVEVLGTPAPVLEGVASYPQNGVSHFAVSDSGALAFLPSSFVFTEQKLVSIDRKGKVQVIRENLHTHGGIRLSPDGRRLALTLRESGHAPDIWIQDLTRGTLSRLTHGPSSNFAPLWLPDRKRILYTSERPIFDLYSASADGSVALNRHSLRRPTISMPRRFLRMARLLSSARPPPAPARTCGVVPWRRFEMPSRSWLLLSTNVGPPFPPTDDGSSMFRMNRGNVRSM
jgi:hypothetical protein